MGYICQTILKIRIQQTTTFLITTNILVDNDPSQLPYFLVTIIGSNGEKTTFNIRTFNIRYTNLKYYIKGDEKSFSIQLLSDEENIKLTVIFPKNQNPPKPPVPTKPKPVNNGTDKIHRKNIQKTSVSMKSTELPIIAVFLVY